MTVTCSHNNQRCVVKCGGDAGGCRLINEYLQLTGPYAGFSDLETMAERRAAESCISHDEDHELVTEMSLVLMSVMVLGLCSASGYQRYKLRVLAHSTRRPRIESTDVQLRSSDAPTWFRCSGGELKV